MPPDYFRLFLTPLYISYLVPKLSWSIYTDYLWRVHQWQTHISIIHSFWQNFQWICKSLKLFWDSVKSSRNFLRLWTLDSSYIAYRQQYPSKHQTPVSAQTKKASHFVSMRTRFIDSNHIWIQIYSQLVQNEIFMVERICLCNIKMSLFYNFYIHEL